MKTQNNSLYRLKYPYLTQLFGLSGWTVFTPIILPSDCSIPRRTLLELKTSKRPLRIVEEYAWRIRNGEDPIQSVKVEWHFYWDKPAYDKEGRFTLELRASLMETLRREKLVGYMFCEPDLHFSRFDVVRLFYPRRG